MTAEQISTAIKNILPNRAIDISEALDLLSDILNSTRLDIGTELLQANTNKDFKLLSQLAEVSQEITVYEDKIQDFRNLLELDVIPDVVKDEPEEEKILPDYEKYRVDSNIEYTLYENLTNKRPFAFQIESDKIMVNTWQEMLLKTVEILYSKDPKKMKSFVTDEDMNGRKVHYFSLSSQAAMRKPIKIANAEFYVETNRNANSIRNGVISMLQRYGIKIADFKIYLRADYSELHNYIGG
ncbi:hypothetical protein SOV_35160 [Sporomusa ovata DSM 2662]|uniref:RloF n=1 Tax=Sporomusa ovata TaxID=2378 RepID=A0A0U1L5P1_9FIRM|nr:hypothetical protein [Sporomusa ovata]EQB24665.1 hypothetical protein SOV_6c00790 [Sporomusa ovata DSM 2662]CQR75012.1 RloF [Sporomusa ovata]